MCGSVLGHFPDRHFADRQFAERQFEDRTHFDGDYTSVSHLIGLNRKIYFAMRLIPCINIHNRIKIHIPIMAVFFNFLSLTGI